jgi:hypothetical protein
MGHPDSSGAAKNANLFMMLGYAHDRYLMVRTTLSPDVGGDDAGRHTGATDSAAENEAKTEDLH